MTEPLASLLIGLGELVVRDSRYSPSITFMSSLSGSRAGAELKNKTNWEV